MTAQIRPSAQQVAVAWLKTLTDLSGVDVATTLAPVADWTGQDFVTAGPSLGGVPSGYVPVRVPVIQIDTWAKAPNSNRPAWNRASVTAEAIRDACYGGLQHGLLTLPGNFMDVYLHGVMPMSEPRRMQGDVAAMARYTITLEFHYTPVNLVIA